MNISKNLLAQESHFEFGKNWASYAKLITQSQIETAVIELQRLLGDRLDGRRFLDIGCGSGLHSLAALRLGAAEVVAIDIDPDSVETAQGVLRCYAPDESWLVLKASVFDIDPKELGEFDVVYSWGVLHHTGDLRRALKHAGRMVRSEGKFAVALYQRTAFCWFWKLEKQWYAHGSQRAQKAARAVYLTFFRLTYPLRLRSHKKYVAEYQSRRGMDFLHDVHDWMGGWPYESMSSQQVDRLMLAEGFKPAGSFARPRFALGVFGSGCQEYLYSKAIGSR